MPVSHKPKHFIVIARIIKEWGVKGSLKTLPLSSVFTCLKPQDQVWLSGPSGDREKRKVSSLKPLGKYFVISLDGIHDIEAAKVLRNAVVEVAQESLPSLDEGEYYHDQIVGLSVLNLQGDVIGTVAEILSTGSNDVYVVRGGNREYLIPAIRDIIREVDLEGGRIFIDTIEGLLD